VQKEFYDQSSSFEIIEQKACRSYDEQDSRLTPYKRAPQASELSVFRELTTVMSAIATSSHSVWD
jgi:hypothetical protein